MTRVAVERVAAGGDGVGRLEDGRVVFIPRSAPGDEVEIEITAARRRFARARIARVLTASTRRTEPPCAHYAADACGGCQLQHLEYPAQLEAKRSIVGEAIRRIGRREVGDPEMISAPNPWRYRTKLTLAAAVAGDARVVGLHRLDTPGRVFPLGDCLIAAPGLMQLWRRVRDHLALLPADLEGVVLRLDRERGTHLVVLGGRPPWDAKPLAAALDEPPVALWWQPPRGAARRVAGRGSTYPALAFEQVNPELGARIRRDAVARLGELGGRVVWDLYGGVGDTARLLAAAGARVWSVDADRRAVDWARRQVGPDAGAVEYLAARAEDVLRRLPEPWAVVVNPPRTGLHQRVAAFLERWAAGRPACASYVSCDPATLARDLARMPTLRISSLTAYDLFPQTAHVEVLAALAGAGAEAGERA